MLSGEILCMYQCCIKISTLYRHSYPKKSVTLKNTNLDPPKKFLIMGHLKRPVQKWINAMRVWCEEAVR